MSGMVASLKIEKPDEAVCSMTISMALADWKQLHAQLTSNSHPAWRLREIILRLVHRAEERFNATDEAE